jgi:hypothetical protein
MKTRSISESQRESNRKRKQKQLSTKEGREKIRGAQIRSRQKKNFLIQSLQSEVDYLTKKVQLLEQEINQLTELLQEKQYSS